MYAFIFISNCIYISYVYMHIYINILRIYSCAHTINKLTQNRSRIGWVLEGSDGLDENAKCVTHSRTHTRRHTLSLSVSVCLLLQGSLPRTRSHLRGQCSHFSLSFFLSLSLSRVVCLPRSFPLFRCLSRSFALSYSLSFSLAVFRYLVYYVSPMKNTNI